MKESLHLQQDLRQQQRLTPLQVQFVRLLEMTGPEIETEVERSLEDMPALEIAEASDADQPDDNEFNESPEEMQAADFANDDDTPSYMLEARNHSYDDQHYEPIAVNDEASLVEMLSTQLADFDLNEREKLIASYIIGNLDGNGYLNRSLQAIADDIAFTQGIDVSLDEMNSGWQHVRRLDPAGVGAADLRDCLLLQLRRKPESEVNKLAEDIVNHYFDLFTKKHYRRLLERLDVSDDQLRAAIDQISRLNPKPGNQQGDTAIESTGRQIVPEFLVEPDGNNLTVTLLNNIPDLTISQTFSDESMVQGATPRQRQEALTFMRSRRDEAANFIKTLKLRQATLFSVMTAIAKIQRDFFMTGDETKLKPMILKDVAALTCNDLSVISRATASKYVMTVGGLYPLKFFFNEKPREEEDATFHQIADAMRRIIDAEDKSSPLSDEAITARLTELGIGVARRTVAKYRERLGYPVARLRKEI